MGTDRDASRERLLARLHKARTIVPVFAHELASARRQAARLRVENRKLVEQVRLLQRQRTVKDGTRVGARERSSGELGAARSPVALGRSARARRAGDEVRIGQR